MAYIIKKVAIVFDYGIRMTLIRRVSTDFIFSQKKRLQTKPGQITFWERRAPARHGIVKPIDDYAELGLSAPGINRPVLFICPALNW